MSNNRVSYDARCQTAAARYAVWDLRPLCRGGSVIRTQNTYYGHTGSSDNEHALTPSSRVHRHREWCQSEWGVTDVYEIRKIASFPVTFVTRFSYLCYQHTETRWPSEASLPFRLSGSWSYLILVPDDLVNFNGWLIPDRISRTSVVMTQGESLVLIGDV